MQCAESLRVQAYFDGELEAVSAAELERHLEHCAECRALLAGLEELRGHIRRDVPLERAPAALRARINRALDTQARGARPGARGGMPAWRTRPFWLGATGGFGAALAAALAVVFVSALAPPAPLDELVAAHVRSLMPAHLTDVISTDQHTVKPWFAGHADVSPAVADFAAQGYRLVGGRADYLNRQRAAVVVYQHGAHVINVFSWTAGRARYPASSTRSGYHLVLWRVGDLEYCAVSDAGWEELQKLTGLLRDLGTRDARQGAP